MTEKLTGIAGSMFSGKTAELIRLIERAEIAGRKTQVFKPIIDKRWGKVEAVRSHSGAEHAAIPVEASLDILKLLDPKTEVVGIDEAQFFDDDIVEVVEVILEKDIPVIIAGLPLDFRGEPFGKMPVLLAKSDEITRIPAICKFKDDGEICGADATRTQRIIDGHPANYGDPIIMIGAEESYEARCPNHHFVPGRPSGRERGF
jgi:thymidine kinase